jgi:hypothetical protein
MTDTESDHGPTPSVWEVAEGENEPLATTTSTPNPLLSTPQASPTNNGAPSCATRDDETRPNESDRVDPPSPEQTGHVVRPVLGVTMRLLGLTKAPTEATPTGLWVTDGEVMAIAEPLSELGALPSWLVSPWLRLIGAVTWVFGRRIMANPRVKKAQEAQGVKDERDVHRRGPGYGEDVLRESPSATQPSAE